jgi:hypothetical protein
VAVTTIAGKWVKENSGLKSDRMAHWGKPRPPKTELAAYLRRSARTGQTVKQFVEGAKSVRQPDCIFVPGAINGRPKTVRFLGRTISAARYMALLTLGAPRHDDAVVRHLCGNGHLSCVNPDHLEWGSAADNIGDMSKHRGRNTAQERIFAISEKR